MKKYKVEGRKIVNICLLSLMFILLLSNIFASQLEYLLYLKPKIANSACTQIHFVDVGQGDAIVVKFSNEKVMLIDSGPKEYNKKLTYYLDNVVLKNKKSIDYVVLTHPDIDHSGNMSYIISNYKIGKFFRPRIFEKYENSEPFCENETYRQIIQALLKYNVDTEFLGEKEWYEGDAKINFLSTLEYFYDLNNISTNDFSPTIIIEENNSKIMLNGDISDTIEAQLIDKYSADLLDVDILKLAHHGSKYSSSEEFLEVTSPTYLIASCGVNTYGHPANDTLKRLLDYDQTHNSTLFNNFSTTKDSGNIIYTLDDDIKVDTIKNVDNYNFASYFVYSSICILYLAFVISLPYLKVWKLNKRYIIQNREFEKMKQQEKLNSSSKNMQK